MSDRPFSFTTTRRAWLLGSLSALAAACSPAVAPAPTQVAAPTAPTAPSPASVGLTASPSPAVASVPSPSPLAVTGPIRPNLKVGLASNGKTYLPMYVTADRTAQLEGLQIELITLSGGAPLIQALAGGSIDVGLTGLNSLVNAINTGQSMKAFYTGVSLGDYQWFGGPNVKSWADLKGKSIGVTGPGSLIDLFSRVIVRKHGLEPERDVQMVTVGNPPTALQALQGGRVDAAVLTNPTAWRAEEAGFARIGTLGTEMVDEYPQSVLIASERTIQNDAATLRALLRAQVRAARMIDLNQDASTEALVKNVRMERADAERTYSEVKGRLNERGELPARAMPFFWQVALLAGDAREEWPESRYFDRSFVNTFDQWAPPVG